jgi:hypothetical protein
MIIEGVKAFISYVSLPKEGFTKCVEPVKTSEIVPTCTLPFESVASTGTDRYYEKPPYIASKN